MEGTVHKKMAKAQGPRIRKGEDAPKKDRLKKGRKPSRIGSKVSPLFAKPFRIIGKVLRKVTPRFLRGAFSEIRQVSWPDRKETLRLTWAVFVFAIVFSVIIAALDFVLDKIFKSIILG